MKIANFHDNMNPAQEVYIDADDFSNVVPFVTGSIIRVKSSDSPILVHESPNEVIQIIQDALES